MNNCDNCNEEYCNSDYQNYDHWTPKKEYKDCPECGAPYPLAHKPYCKIGEAFK